MFRVSASVFTHPQSWAIWIGLSIVCLGYAFFVVRNLRKGESSSQTGWLVVIGNSLVSVAAAAVIGSASDLETGITVLVVLLATNAFGGWPMLLEHQMWYQEKHKHIRRNAQIRSMLPQEDDD